MRIVVSFTTIVLLLLTQWLSSADTKSWRGIVPLRSTRADVEALLGEGTHECKYIKYSAARQYENQYELFWPEFAAKMFGVKNKKEFLRLVRKSGGFEDVFIEFKPKSITVQEDKTYGKVYEVFGLARAWHDARVLESYRTTRMVLKGGELYFVDLFNLIPR